MASDECAPSAKLLVMHSESGTPRWSERNLLGELRVRSTRDDLHLGHAGTCAVAVAVGGAERSALTDCTVEPAARGAAARGTGKGALPTVGASWSPLKPDDSDPNRSRAQMGSEEEEEEEEQGEECVLVIDIGSSSTRCVAYGMDCRPLELRRRRRHAL